jgi:ParB family chromosome partitioning protein
MRHGAHFVDELTQRAEEPTVGRLVALEDIEPDPEQPRKDLGNLDELVDSVRRKGVLEPILVRPNPDFEPGGARYRIISGERRFRAAEAAELVEVPVIEMEVNDEEALEIALIENLQRKDLTPFEEAEAFQALGERFAYTHEQIADALGRSRTVITESLSLLVVPEPIRELADALEVRSKSLLLEVAKLATPEEMESAIRLASQQKLTRDDLRQRTRRRPASRPTPKPSPRPHVFRFDAPDKSFNISLSFRRDMVAKQDLIDALEQTLFELRREVRRHGDAPL